MTDQNYYVFYNTNKYTLDKSLLTRSDYFKQFSEYSNEFHLAEYEKEFKVINDETRFINLLSTIKSLYKIKTNKKINLYKNNILQDIKIINGYHMALIYFGHSDYLNLLHDASSCLLYNVTVSFLYNNLLYDYAEHHVEVLAMNPHFLHILNLDYYTDKFIQRCKKYPKILKTMKMDLELFNKLANYYFDILLWNKNIPFEFLEQRFKIEYGFEWLTTRDFVPWDFMNENFMHISFSRFRKMDFIPFQFIKTKLVYFESFLYILSSNMNIPLEFLEQYPYRIDWPVICQRRDVTKEFIRRNIQYMNWMCISFNEFISNDIYDEFSNEVDWGIISMKISNEELMEKYIDRLSFESLIHNRNVSMGFIMRHLYKFLKKSIYTYMMNLPLELVENKVDEMINNQVSLLNKHGIQWESIYSLDTGKIGSKYISNGEMNNARLDYEEFWKILIYNQYLPSTFFDKYYEFIPKDIVLLLSANKNITIDFLDRHPDCISISYIIENPSIPINYKLKYKKRFISADYRGLLEEEIKNQFEDITIFDFTEWRHYLNKKITF